MGAVCAWSRRTVREDGVWVFTCAACGGTDGVPVVDERPEGKDPVERA